MSRAERRSHEKRKQKSRIKMIDAYNSTISYSRTARFDPRKLGRLKEGHTPYIGRCSCDMCKGSDLKQKKLSDLAELEIKVAQLEEEYDP